MTAIWAKRDDQWNLLSPSTFPDEAALHDRISEAPQLLPLAGSPAITVLGREVRLGSGLADLIAVEHTGRPVVIEIKLARNAEARRAVIAQVLAYAAYLFGLTVEQLERDVLGQHLRSLGHGSVVEAVEANDQAGRVDRVEFEDALAENLQSGHFRLVLVLDDAPEELVKLVGYLEAVTPELTIDLIKVSQYDVGGSQLLVPQRVDPERVGADDRVAASATKREGYSNPGIDDFLARIETAPEEAKPSLRKAAEWAAGLESLGVNLWCYHGKKDILTLLPYLPVENVGLVTVWYDDAGAIIVFWRSVFERRAPNALPRVEAAVAPAKVAQNATTRNITDELLDALTAAYSEAIQSISRSS